MALRCTGRRTRVLIGAVQAQSHKLAWHAGAYMHARARLIARPQIRVYCRVKPHPSPVLRCLPDQVGVTLSLDGKEHGFSYDRVFQPGESQEQVRAGGCSRSKEHASDWESLATPRWVLPQGWLHELGYGLAVLICSMRAINWG